MPECLDSFPWQSLKGCGSMASAMFHVGDYKNERLKDGSAVQFRIIGFNHDRTSSGVVLPMTWEMVDGMGTRFQWNRNDSNAGSWEGSLMRQNMNKENGAIFRLMPEEIIEVAVPVIKLTANTQEEGCPIIETEDLFWIKSEKETYGRNFYSAPGEGRWYEYYRQEDVSYAKLRNGSLEVTALRSPYRRYSSYFCMVDRVGIPNGEYASYSCAVAPAFSF